MAGQAFRRALARTLVVVAILILNPFGVVEWSDLRSRAVWQNINADHYGSEGAGRRQITVVELDQASLESAAPVDTAPDSIHLLNIFRTVHNDRAYNGDGGLPRALFIDLLLGHLAPDGVSQQQLLDFDSFGAKCPEALGDRLDYANPDDVSPFACMVRGIAEMTAYDAWRDDDACVKANPVGRIHCILKAKGTPVLIASSVDPAQRKAPFVSAGDAALAAVAVSVPVLVKDRAYPLVHPRDSLARENAHYSVYPAALLYTAFCSRGGDCETQPHIGPTDSSDPSEPEWRSSYWGWRSDFERPMEVFWGVGAKDRFTNAVDSASGGLYERDCRPADRRWGLFRAFFTNLVSGVAVGGSPPCVYTHSLPYRLLRWPRNGGPEKLRSAALADKIVLIGMSTADSNDFIEAGSHGRLPGVFYHAMALDNLIEHGPAYSPVPDPILPPLSLTDRDVQNALAALLILFVGALFTVYERERSDRTAAEALGRMMLRSALLTVAAAAVILSLLYLVTGSALLDRFNFVALSLVALLEIIKVAFVLARPILVRIGETNSMVRVLLGIQSESPARRRRKGGSDASVPVGASARRRRRKSGGDRVQSIPTDPL
ncbi:MAG: CHASE2 domain-containing protein [Allosphingosinicella sp.]